MAAFLVPESVVADAVPVATQVKLYFDSHLL